MTKLKAFTILEMLMSLGVMSLIVSFVYFLYVSFSGQVQDYFKTTTTTEEVYGFYTQFRKEVYLATSIKSVKNKLQLVNYDEKVVEYYFDSKFLIRKQQNQTDSLRLVDFDWKYLSNRNSKEQLVNNIVFKTLLYGKEIEFSINKSYPSGSKEVENEY